YAVTVSNGYCSASEIIGVVVSSVPVDVLNDITRCEGADVILDAGNAGSTYLWNNGSETRTTTVTSAGTYSVEITNTQNCSATYVAVVQFVAPPVVELGADTVLCTGEPLVLD